MKKSLLAVAVALALILTACAPAATPPPENTSSQPVDPVTVQQTVIVKETVVVPPTAVPEDPATITFWHSYNENSPENQMLVETLIPIFEEAHPDIKVQPLSVPWEDFRRKLFTSISGGVAPDLIRSDIIWVPELADQGALVALDEAMPDFEEYKQIMFPGPLSTNFWKGHYYGLPLDTNTKVWLYNQELYGQAGISAPPATVDEMEAQCQALKSAKADAYYFAADGTFAWVTLPWIWSFGGAVTDPEVTTATGYLNGPDSVAAYEFLLKMYDAGCVSPVILGNGVDPFTGFAQDLYANIDNGPWTYPIIESQFPDKQIHAAPFPGGKGGSVNVVGGEDVVLFKQSQHPEQAMEFIRFMMSEEYQMKMAEVGQLPVRNDLIDSDFFKSHPYYGYFLEQLKTSQSRTAHPNWSKMDEIITEAGQLILRHEKTPQEALDEAAAKIDALLTP